MGAAETVTVIVPARNASSTLPECLAALANQTHPPTEIIVVDDASGDATAETVTSSGARVIRQPRNAGPGSARAVGLASSSGEFVVFTDADCVPDPSFIECLVAALENGASAAKGAYYTTQRGLIPRFVQLEFEERYDLLRRHAATDFVDGHAAAYRRSDLMAAGGIDRGLRLSQNVETGYRLAELGRVIRFVPEARTRHRHPDSLSHYARAKFERAFWRARSYRWHPRKALSDSYTPSTLKLQVGILGLWLALAPVSVWLGYDRRAVALATAVLAGAFIFTALPLLARALRSDPAVATIALPMLAVRAAAIGAGAVLGVLSLPAALLKSA